MLNFGIYRGGGKQNSNAVFNWTPVTFINNVSEFNLEHQGHHQEHQGQNQEHQEHHQEHQEHNQEHQGHHQDHQEKLK